MLLKWAPPMLRAPRLVPSLNMFWSLADQTPGQRVRADTVPNTVLAIPPGRQPYATLLTLT